MVGWAAGWDIVNGMLDVTDMDGSMIERVDKEQPATSPVG